MIEKEDGTIEIRDEEINRLLLCMRIENITRIVGDDGKMYLVWKATEEVKDAIDRWLKNKPTPIKDFRDVVAGEKIYKSNLHAHLNERRNG